MDELTDISAAPVTDVADVADVAETAAVVDECADNDPIVAGMTDLLVKAVRALGAAGQPEQASRIAGKAWWVLKDAPRQAERVNGTMHYLARLEQSARGIGEPD